MKTTVIQIRLTAALCNAAIDAATADGATLSEFVRAAIADRLGDVRLADMPPQGRPAKKRTAKTAAK